MGCGMTLRNFNGRMRGMRDKNVSGERDLFISTGGKQERPWRK